MGSKNLEFVGGYATRVRAAQQRYGSRAFVLMIYRMLFQWPRLRSGFVGWRLRAVLGAKVGEKVRFGKRVFVRLPAGAIVIGAKSTLSDGCRIEVSAAPAATVSLGANCYLAPDVHVISTGSVEIGNNVQIAEFTSIRDTSHNYRARDVIITQQGDTVGHIKIGNDVWIGKGCLILGTPETVVIGDGVVIGAHSTVKDSIPDYAIAVGSPARVVGNRS